MRQQDATPSMPSVEESSTLPSGARRVSGQRSNQTHLTSMGLTDKSGGESMSPAQAVLLGALAPGVNGPTWSTLKITFITLGVCLAAMLYLAFSAGDLAVTIHVVFLIVISAVLFLILQSFLAQTGLVSVEDQMKEMGLAPKSESNVNKES